MGDKPRWQWERGQQNRLCVFRSAEPHLCKTPGRYREPMTVSSRAKGVFTGQLTSPEIAEAVRRLGLYPLARRTLFAADYARNYRENQTVRKNHPDIAFPPAELLWATAPTTSYRIYLTGKQAAEGFYQLAARYLPQVRRIYELGCGASSVLRHMPEVAEGLEAFGSDYDPKLVDWCKANIPNVNVALNSLEPPLHYDDESFDFVYSRSVFTHLSSGLQKQWLAEQLRITRPGGLVLVTVHGDAYKHRLTAVERAEYEATGFVEHRTADDGGPWYTTFNSPTYMERELLAGLEVVHRDVLPEEACGLRQDTWLVRKPA